MQELRNEPKSSIALAYLVVPILADWSHPLLLLGASLKCSPTFKRVGGHLSGSSVPADATRRAPARRCSLKKL
jgi:hypothetical protein